MFHCRKSHTAVAVISAALGACHGPSVFEAGRSAQDTLSSGGQAARQASEDPKVLPPIEMPLDSVNSLAVLWQEMVTEQDEIHIYGDYLAAQLAGGKVTNDRAHALYSRQFNSLRNQAEQLAAAQDLEALDGDKVLMAADIMLMRWKNHTEVQELLAEFKDAPEQWKSRRAFWWTVYRYCGADQPEQLENVWWDSQILHPHLINQRVRYASPLSLALRDFGRIDAAQTMLEGALALALSSRASIVEHDDGDPWEYRRVSQATLARTVCLLASLKDDDARPVCLAEWRMKLSKFPKALELIEALWPAYEMYNRPFPRIRQTSIEGQVVDTYELKGKLVLIEFSASWCGACQGQLELLKALRKQYGNEIALIGVNADHNLRAFNRWRKENDLSWPHLGEFEGVDGTLCKQFGVQGLPAIFILDQEGCLIYRGIDAAHLPMTIKRFLK